MATELDPIVGNWYQNMEKEITFEVVAIDEDEGTVEVQFSEGEIEEIDIDDWYEMTLEEAAEPDDWLGADEDVDEEEELEEIEELDDDDDLDDDEELDDDDVDEEDENY
jgi:hypothetical protein